MESVSQLNVLLKLNQGLLSDKTYYVKAQQLKGGSQNQQKVRQQGRPQNQLQSEKQQPKYSQLPGQTEPFEEKQNQIGLNSQPQGMQPKKQQVEEQKQGKQQQQIGLNSQPQGMQPKKQQVEEQKQGKQQQQIGLNSSGKQQFTAQQPGKQTNELSSSGKQQFGQQQAKKYQDEEQYNEFNSSGKYQQNYQPELQSTGRQQNDLQSSGRQPNENAIYSDHKAGFNHNQSQMASANKPPEKNMNTSVSLSQVSPQLPQTAIQTPDNQNNPFLEGKNVQLTPLVYELESEEQKNLRFRPRGCICCSRYKGFKPLDNDKFGDEKLQVRSFCLQNFNCRRQFKREVWRKSDKFKIMDVDGTLCCCCRTHFLTVQGKRIGTIKPKPCACMPCRMPKLDFYENEKTQPKYTIGKKNQCPILCLEICRCKCQCKGTMRKCCGLCYWQVPCKPCCVLFNNDYWKMKIRNQSGNVVAQLNWMYPPLCCILCRDYYVDLKVTQNDQDLFYFALASLLYFNMGKISLSTSDI